MHLSIIIPAYNEEQLITHCLNAVAESLNANARTDFTHEIIVVDNNSADKTAERARKSGAHVVFEPINQISRARNAGAAAARGDWLLFVDADSLLNPGMVADILACIDSGRYVGCGSLMKMPESPWWGKVILKTWSIVSVTFAWASGALVVCRSDAFREVGGFDQNLYAADEIYLSGLLKQWGRRHGGLKFTILKHHPLITSARKLRLYSSSEIAKQFFKVVCSPRKALQNRNKLPIWYDGRRE
ncbi:MAG: glycosyltransferase [Nitrosomonas sp.]|nr:glycosyltransferase [Nitrosomonas sp.]